MTATEELPQLSNQPVIWKDIEEEILYDFADSEGEEQAGFFAGRFTTHSAAKKPYDNISCLDLWKLLYRTNLKVNIVRRDRDDHLVKY